MKRGGWRRAATVIAVAATVVATMSTPAAARPPDCPDVAASAAQVEGGEDMRRAERPGEGLLEQVVGADQADAPGCFPASRYTIGYSEDGWMRTAGSLLSGRGDRLGAKATGWATEGTWSLVRWLVSIANRLLAWAFSFSFAAMLGQPAAKLAGAYHHSLSGGDGGPNVYQAGLFVAVAYGAVVALRGRVIHGAGEFGVSLVVLTVFAAFVVAAPGGIGSLVDRALRFTARLSGAVVAMTGEECGSDCQQPPPAGPYQFPEFAALLAPLTDGLQAAYIAEPYDLIAWGSQLGRADDPANPTARCAAARDVILTSGPWQTAEEPRTLMRNAGCETQAAFNAEPSPDRLGAAVLVLLGAVVVLVVMALLAITVIGAQLAALVLIAVMPFAIVAGTLPGAGRQGLWRWAAALLRVAATIVVVSLLLALMLRALRVVLAASAEQPLLVRMGTFVTLTAAMVAVRKRMLQGGQRLAARIGGRLERARLGGAHGGGWLAPAATGGISGLGIGQLLQEGRSDYRQLTHNATTRAVVERLQRARHHSPAASSIHGRGPAGERNGGLVGGVAAWGPARGMAAAGRGVKHTVNFPVSLPRAAARTTVAASQAKGQVLAALDRGRGHVAEWRWSLDHPRAAYHKHKQQIAAAAPGRPPRPPKRSPPADADDPLIRGHR